MLKRINLIIIFCLVLSLLVGCNVQTSEVIIKNENFIIEDIRFDKNLIYIDTEKETIVYFPFDIDFFSKTNEPSYINYKTIEKRSDLEKNLLTGEYSTEETTTIYINENSIKDVSKRYANAFNHTLFFNEENDNKE